MWMFHPKKGDEPLCSQSVGCTGDEMVLAVGRLDLHLIQWWDSAVLVNGLYISFCAEDALWFPVLRDGRLTRTKLSNPSSVISKRAEQHTQSSLWLPRHQPQPLFHSSDQSIWSHPCAVRQGSVLFLILAMQISLLASRKGQRKTRPVSGIHNMQPEKGRGSG